MSRLVTRLLLALIVCLTVAAPAYAQNRLRLVHQVAPSPSVPLNIGSESPTGYGGEQPFPGATSIVSQTSPCSSTPGNVTVVLDGNGNIVPNDKATHSYPGVAAKYGLIGALTGMSGDCTITETNGVDNVSFTMHIVLGAYTVTPKPGAASHPDSNSNWELSNLLAHTQSPGANQPHVPLGATIYCRDGQINATPASSGDNRYTLSIPTPPVGGNGFPWSGTAGDGPIIITSENPAASTTVDPWGNTLHGGGCKMAQINIKAATNGPTFDVNTPLTFRNISFTTGSYVGTLATNIPMISDSNGNIYGVTFDQDYFSYGLGITNGFKLNLITWTYTGANSSQPFKVTNSYGTNGQAFDAVMTPGNAHRWGGDFENDVLQGMGEIGIEATGSSPTIIKNPLVFNLRACCGSHADVVDAIGLTSDGLVHPGMTITGLLGEHGTETPSAIQTLTYTSTDSGMPVNGNYIIATGLPNTTTSGAGRLAYIDVHVTGCPSCVLTANPNLNNLALNKGFALQSGGYGYQVGDTLHITTTMGGLPVVTTWTVAAVVPTSDGSGIFEDGQFNDSATGAVIRNNIVDLGLDTQKIDMGHQTNANVNYNDAIQDVEMMFPNIAAGLLPTSPPTSGRISFSIASNINADRNIANLFANTITSCYPSTDPATCTANLVSIGSSVATGLANYRGVWPNYSTAGPYNRPTILFYHTPAVGTPTLSPVTAQNPDGTYKTALFPDVPANDASGTGTISGCVAANTSGGFFCTMNIASGVTGTWLVGDTVTGMGISTVSGTLNATGVTVYASGTGGLGNYTLYSPSSLSIGSETLTGLAPGPWNDGSVFNPSDMTWVMAHPPAQ